MPKKERPLSAMDRVEASMLAVLDEGRLKRLARRVRAWYSRRHVSPAQRAIEAAIKADIAGEERPQGDLLLAPIADVYLPLRKHTAQRLNEQQN